MERYNKIEIEKTTLGKRYYKTVRYPEIPKSISDIYIVGQAGDRIDLLAQKYYNDITLWWIIARANNIGKGDLVVPLGKQLRIPTNTIKIVTEFNKINT
tara:strand:- start:2137 stop:2433 length:297 start_codon:yes stop_codon:yes gene_type:complete